MEYFKLHWYPKFFFVTLSYSLAQKYWTGLTKIDKFKVEKRDKWRANRTTHKPAKKCFFFILVETKFWQTRNKIKSLKIQKYILSKLITVSILH